jgi:hypothetical protein
VERLGQRGPWAVACVLVVWLLASMPCEAQTLADEPEPDARDVPRVKRAPLLPLLEVLLFNAAFVLSNRVFVAEPWTEVSASSIARNLAGPWQFDHSGFEVNFLGHPLHGAQAFMAARSAGFDFYPSIFSSGLSSLLWELAGEAEPPAINDFVNHTLGGALLGETLHRAAFVAERAPQWPEWLRRALSVLLDPWGNLNRLILGQRLDESELSGAPALGQLSLGLRTLVRLESSRTHPPSTVGRFELHLAGKLKSGTPGERPRRPFDLFEVSGELAVGARPWAALFVTGLLEGVAFQSQGKVVGTFGLAGNYDFSNRPALRVSAISTGPGLWLTWKPLDTVQVSASGGVSLAILGGAGVVPEGERDYHLGPGAQAWGALVLSHAHWGSLRGGARQWLVGPGDQSASLVLVTLLQGGISLPLLYGFEATVDLISAAQPDALEPDLPSWESRLCFGVTWSPGR